MLYKEQLEKEIEALIVELGFAYSYWFPDKPNAAAIKEHVNPLYRRFVQQLTQGINFAEADVLPWDEIEGYVSDALLPEFKVQNQATIDKCVMFMATIYRAIQAQIALLEEDEPLALKRAFQATHFCGVLRGMEKGFQETKSRASMISEMGKHAVSFREDQQLKPQWQAHCKKAIESGRAIARLNDLFQIEGCRPDFKKNIDVRTLKRWAKEAAGIEFKPGRPKK